MAYKLKPAILRSALSECVFSAITAVLQRKYVLRTKYEPELKIATLE